MILIRCKLYDFQIVDDLIKWNFKIIDKKCKTIPNFICQRCYFNKENIYLTEKYSYYFITLEDKNINNLNLIKNNNVLKKLKISINNFDEEYYEYFKDIIIDYNIKNPCCEIFKENQLFKKLTKIWNFFWKMNYKLDFVNTVKHFFIIYSEKYFDKNFNEFFCVDDEFFSKNNNLLDYLVPFNIYTKMSFNDCFLIKFQNYFWKLLEIQDSMKAYKGTNIIIQIFTKKLILNNKDNKDILILKELILENVINYIKIKKEKNQFFIINFNLNIFKWNNIKFLILKELKNNNIEFNQKLNFQNLFKFEENNIVNKIEIIKEIEDYFKQLKYIISIINSYKYNIHIKKILLINLIEIIYFLMKLYNNFNDINDEIKNLILKIKKSIKNLFNEIDFNSNGWNHLKEQIYMIKFNLYIILKKNEIKIIKTLLIILNNFKYSFNNERTFEVDLDNNFLKFNLKEFSELLFYDNDNDCFYIKIKINVFSLYNNINIFENMKLIIDENEIIDIKEVNLNFENNYTITFYKYLKNKINKTFLINKITFKIQNFIFNYNFNIKSNDIDIYNSINLIESSYKYKFNNEFILNYNSYYELFLDFKIFNNFHEYNLIIDFNNKSDLITIEDDLILFINKSKDNHNKFKKIEENKYKLDIINKNNKKISILIKFKIEKLKDLFKLKEVFFLNFSLKNCNSNSNYKNRFEINPNLLKEQNYIDFKMKFLEDKVMIKILNKLNSIINKIKFFDNYIDIKLKNNEEYNLILNENLENNFNIICYWEDKIYNTENQILSNELISEINLNNLICKNNFLFFINFNEKSNYLDIISFKLKLNYINKEIENLIQNCKIFIEIIKFEDYEIINKNKFEYDIKKKEEIIIEMIPLKIGNINYPKLNIICYNNKGEIIYFFKHEEVKIIYNLNLFIRPKKISYIKANLFN